jgi:hypothetical protein
MQDSLSHEAFAHVVNTEGGASHNIKTAKPAEGPGVMVSVPGAEKITAAPITPEQVKSFREKHSNVASNDEYHGAWKSGDKVFQDISRKEPNLNAARAAGTAGKQIAGYDLGGTDTARPEGGEVFFDRRVPGRETDSAWKPTATSTSVPERMSPKPKSKERVEYANVNRSATRMNKAGNKVPVSINEVYATIAKNRRNRGV